MPRYYFDVHDDSGAHRDDVGLELPDMDSAIAEARRALADMAREAIATGQPMPLQILIRDGDEGPVLLEVSTKQEWIE